MRRADRLFQIVQYLRGGRLVTARQLAGRLEVSERTVYRDVADLISTGVPIEGEAGVGYLMREGFDLPPLMFNRDEIAALVAGARMIRAWGGASMARAAEEALVKIEAVLPDDARAKARQVQIFAPDFQMTQELRTRFDEVENAVEKRRRLVLAYADVDGALTERTVRPLGLWFWGKVWTIAGWCEMRDDFRVFRLDRIDKMEFGAPFQHEPDKSLRAFFRSMESDNGGRP